MTTQIIPALSLVQTHLPLFSITALPTLCPRHHYQEGPGIPSVFVHVLRTELGSLTYTD